jgi:hypothetical protein
MNVALPVEEAYRILTDEKQNGHLVLLDAKARRSACSLFVCGFHGHNGLDPESLLHIYKTYITPVLLYGMELLLPSSKNLLNN